MKLVEFHDLNNPARVVLFDADDFSTVLPLPTGSVVYRKDSDLPVYVHESPEEVATVIGAV